LTAIREKATIGGNPGIEKEHASIIS